MGAEQFYNKVVSASAREAFRQANEEACHEHGHGGYTGTIAEKSSYSMSNKPNDVDADDWIEMVEDFDENDKDQEHYRELKKDFEVYDDKWGDALCIDCGEGVFVLCGWASS